MPEYILPEDFLTVTESVMGSELWHALLQGLADEAPVSVRINPLKCPADWLPAEGRAERVEWCEGGYYLSSRPNFTFDPLFHAGMYYVQEASSMFLDRVLRSYAADGPVMMLDLCAAPGGKSGVARAALPEGSLLVSNEPVARRASVLVENMAKLGHEDVMVTNNYPCDIGRSGLMFDVMLADVPCSGEGMFRKDSGAVEQWSVENVSLCQARQRRIVADVWPSLAEGGIMIYSTCTFNRYEDDCNAEWICSALGAEKYPLWKELPHEWKIISTEYGSLLVPGLVSGEGQYCAAVRKISAVNGRVKQRQKTGWSRESVPDMFRIPMKYILKGGLVIAVPEAVAEDAMTVESCVRTISTGCAVGEKKGTVTVPSADLALDIMLDEGAFCAAELDLEKALAFLHRDTICIEDSPKGYVKVCYDGLPLGFVKNLGSRCNNMLPQGRRIRMDVRLAGKSGR